jgi:hypothetical protein
MKVPPKATAREMMVFKPEVELFAADGADSFGGGISTECDMDGNVLKAAS